MCGRKLIIYAMIRYAVVRPAPYATSLLTRARLHAGSRNHTMTSKRIPSTDELLEIARSVAAAAEEQEVEAALGGGLAMQLYGSPRLTKDIDFISTSMIAKPPGFSARRKIGFGGTAFSSPDGIELDWIVRDDEYAAFYREALERAMPTAEGFLIVRPEYLSVMKLAAGQPKHYEDLMFLLNLRGIDFKKAHNIAYKHLGRFGADQFEAAVEEARYRARKDR